MRSMTGYGRMSVERDGRQLSVEIKSVNHRFLDLSFRIPRTFAFLEDALRKRVSASLSRGHADVFATYRNLREDSKSVTVDPALLRAYAQAAEDIARATGRENDMTPAKLARMDGLLVISEAEEDMDALTGLAFEATDGALSQLLAMREREGKSLEADMSARLDRLEEITLAVEARYPQTVTEYQEKLAKRVAELLGGASLEPERIAQEVALMADRSAVAEETVRLHSHIAQTRETFALCEPVGRKLDFIVQELNREVNTISSKSQDVAITRLVVEAKAEIEKIREQVQNVE